MKIFTIAPLPETSFRGFCMYPENMEEFESLMDYMLNNSLPLFNEVR